MACTCFKKGNTAIASTQTIAVNDIMEFDYSVRECDYVYLKNNAIVFKKSGTYLVTFNASASPATGDTTSELQLLRNGLPVQGINASINETSLSNISGMSFSTVIDINPSCCASDNTARLTIVCLQNPIIITNAMITVVKLGD